MVVSPRQSVHLGPLSQLQLERDPCEGRGCFLVILFLKPTPETWWSRVGKDLGKGILAIRQAHTISLILYNHLIVWVPVFP